MVQSLVLSQSVETGVARDRSLDHECPSREDSQDRTSGSDTRVVKRPEDRGFKSHRSRYFSTRSTVVPNQFRNLSGSYQDACFDGESEARAVPFIIERTILAVAGARVTPSLQLPDAM